MVKLWESWLAAMCVMGVVLLAGTALAQDDCDTDYNGDGTTDAADVEMLQAALGSSEGDANYLAQADHDGDGTISVLDYGILLSCN